jgi:hypothetical protein
MIKTYWDKGRKKKMWKEHEELSDIQKTVMF